MAIKKGDLIKVPKGYGMPPALEEVIEEVEYAAEGLIVTTTHRVLHPKKHNYEVVNQKITTPPGKVYEPPRVDREIGECELPDPGWGGGHFDGG